MGITNIDKSNLVVISQYEIREWLIAYHSAEKIFANKERFVKVVFNTLLVIFFRFTMSCIVALAIWTIIGFEI